MEAARLPLAEVDEVPDITEVCFSARCLARQGNLVYDESIWQADWGSPVQHMGTDFIEISPVTSVALAEVRSDHKDPDVILFYKHPKEKYGVPLAIFSESSMWAKNGKGYKEPTSTQLTNIHNLIKQIAQTVQQ